MSRQISLIATVIALVIALFIFPFLIQHWLITIARAIPSAFTLGISTVLIYKALRYPRGTAFTLLGLLKLSTVGYLIYILIGNNTYWAIIPVLVAAITIGPRTSKYLWRKLDVDRYYR